MKPLKLITPILFFVLLISNFSYSQTGWHNINHQNTITKNLTSIKIFDSNNFYIFADSNYIFKSTDDGETYTQQPWSYSTKAVYFFNKDVGFAEKDKKLYRTENAGAEWKVVADFTSLYQGQYFEISNLNFINANYGYITVRNSGMQWYSSNILFTSDGGHSWSQLGVNSSGSGSSVYYSSVSAVDFKMLSSSTGYYIKYHMTSTIQSFTENYSMYKTTNGGSNWYDISPNINSQNIYHVDFINENTGYLVVDSLRFYKTTNGGENWVLRSRIPAHADKLYMIDEMNGYVVNLIDFYRTTDGGLTWTLQNTGLNITTGFNQVSFLNPQLGYIIGRNGLILKTQTGGMVSVVTISEAADNYSLSQNYPNPFNPETKIQFSVPKNGLVKVVVFDLLGREVKELVNEFKQQGSYNLSFDGSNLTSGIYFYKLITDGFIETKKMILIK